MSRIEGNGRGGGDFRGENPNVGRWARDRIMARPDGPMALDWTVLTPNFVED